MLDGGSLVQQQGLELAFLDVIEGVEHHGQKLLREEHRDLVSPARRDLRKSASVSSAFRGRSPTHSRGGGVRGDPPICPRRERPFIATCKFYYISPTVLLSTYSLFPAGQLCKEENGEGRTC